MKPLVILVSFLIIIFFQACELKIKNEKSISPIEKKDSLIIPTTITFLDSNLLFLPYDFDTHAFKLETSQQTDSVILVQCCELGGCNQCYEFNITKSQNKILLHEHGQNVYYFKKVVLNDKLLFDFINLYNSKKSYSKKGPESTCCPKYLFISYKNGSIDGIFRVDDCFGTNKGYNLTKRGIKNLKEIVESTGLTFMYYWGESNYE